MLDLRLVLVLVTLGTATGCGAVSAGLRATVGVVRLTGAVADTGLKVAGGSLRLAGQAATTAADIGEAGTRVTTARMNQGFDAAERTVRLVKQTQHERNTNLPAQAAVNTR